MCPNHLEKGILKITYANFKKGRGCIYCSKRARRTDEEYLNDLKNVNKNIQPLEKYVNLKIPILHKCKICNYEWKAKPTNLLHLKEGCPKCSKHRKSLTHNEFLEELEKVNPYIKILDTYVNSVEKVTAKCLKCGNIWKVKPNNLQNGRGCPYCKNSKGEMKVAEILNKNNIKHKKEFIFKDCKCINYLPFDIYLTDYNICIEYDGIQHYEPITFGGISMEEAIENLKYTQKKDKIKTEYCKNNNIKLLRIPYWDFNKIEERIMSFLS